MSIGEVGGNGSVQWEFKVDQQDAPAVQYQETSTPSEHRKRGTDRSAGTGSGSRLILSLLPPGPVSATAFKNSLSAIAQVRGNRVEIELTIEEYKPDQIQIRWGRHV